MAPVRRPLNRSCLPPQDRRRWFRAEESQWKKRHRSHHAIASNRQTSPWPARYHPVARHRWPGPHGLQPEAPASRGNGPEQQTSQGLRAGCRRFARFPAEPAVAAGDHEAGSSQPPMWANPSGGQRSAHSQEVAGATDFSSADGAGGTRTHDLRFRKPSLYPAELQPQGFGHPSDLIMPGRHDEV